PPPLRSTLFPYTTLFRSRRNIFEHESLAIPITQHPSLAAHPFRDQNAAHAWWPNHSRRMELHKFHVHQRRTGMVGERMAIARILDRKGTRLNSSHLVISY